MKAVVFHGVGDIRIDDVPQPRIQDPTAGAVDPSDLITQIADTHDAIEVYEAFDQHRPGWLKVPLGPVTV